MEANSTIDRLTTFGKRQLNLVTRKQALTVISQVELNRLCREGHVIHVRRGVYRLTTNALDFDLKSGLGFGSRSCMRRRLRKRRRGFTSAAVLLGLSSTSPIKMDVTVGGGRRVEQPGVTVHQSAVPKEDLFWVGGIPATGPAKTLVDLAATEKWDWVRWLTRRPFNGGIVTPEEVEAAANRTGVNGRGGVKRLRSMARFRIIRYSRKADVGVSCRAS